jgi:hypothetical protein
MIIKDVYKLNISKWIAELASQLIEQVEYPVVFLINQFWITIKYGTEQIEVERIVLANLYKQVQLRKRYMAVMPEKTYLATLVCKKDGAALERLRSLQNKVAAFTSSLECEMYLGQ